MHKPVNPFFYGGPIDAKKFVGRDNEVGRVFDQLRSHARGSVALIGERRIGKTSLLHYVSAPDVIKRWNINRNHSIFIYQDCGVISPFTITRFWQVILKRLNRELKRRKANQNIIGAVEELLADDEIPTSEIEYLLDELDEAGLLVILMLDEFEWCIRTDPENESTTRDFLAGLRALINYVPRALSVIVATRQPLNEVCKDVRFMGSPFYNNFVFVHLRPFSRGESEILLEQMLAGSEITFSQSEKDMIYGLAGTHPLLLQVAAALVFDFKTRGASRIEDFFPIREQFYNQVKHQFEDLWKWSQLKMQEIMVYFASGKDKKATKLLEKYANEREILIQRGLITRQEASYRLFSPLFKEWLAENFYRLGAKKWLAERDINATAEIVEVNPDSPKVLISYSHKDEDLKERLYVHLGVLQRAAGLIDLWSDDRIGGGDDWEQEISDAIDGARVAILLVSADFLNSEYILGKEVPRLLQRRKGGGLIVIPVIAKDCAWSQVEWLKKMNVRPKNGRPVWREAGVHADEALKSIAEEVAGFMKKL